MDDSQRRKRLFNVLMIYLSLITAVYLVEREHPVVIQALGVLIGFGGLFYALWWAMCGRE